MTKAMILSVGGSPEALVASLNHHKPGLVCFFTSQDSIEMVPKVKETLTCNFKDHKFMVADINDLTGCYQKVVECSDYIKGEGIEPDQVIVDLTGGNKVMSASLTLLAISKGYSISYVGGTQRSKSGLGAVITGTERVFEQVNPWDALAIADRRLAVSFANCYQFTAAEISLESALRKVKNPLDRRYLRGMLFAVQAYTFWERFQHKDAADLLNKSVKELTPYVERPVDQSAQALLRKLEASLQFLNRLRGESKDFKNRCRMVLVDLLGNAKRRSECSMYDDAVARLYRSLEYFGQLGLERHGIPNTGNINPEQVPESIREEYIKNHSKEDGTLKVSLHACFKLLVELGDPIGERYFNNERELRNLLSSRNQSILAHGDSPVKKETFDQFLALVLKFTEINESELPRFPKWPS
ncbi:MAG: TIGR02710 family CRISPR-associated CARF protein [Dehalococcoidales bacterium]|nr:TIGR02710 family CRISPR-associated CARF protein [Dehalococcoidales bacterium]